jgi:hypothetical protein
MTDTNTNTNTENTRNEVLLAAECVEGESPRWVVIHSAILNDRIIVALDVQGLKEARDYLLKIGYDNPKFTGRLVGYTFDEVQAISKLPADQLRYLHTIKMMFRGKIETDPETIDKLSSMRYPYNKVDDCSQKVVRKTEKKQSEISCEVCAGFEVRLTVCIHCGRSACDHLCGFRQVEISDVGQRDQAVCVDCQFSEGYLIFKDCVNCKKNFRWRELDLDGRCEECRKKFFKKK